MSFHVLIIALLVGSVFYVAGIEWLARGVRAVVGRAGTASSRPHVSVVIAARNEELNIARCLRSVLACTYSPFEVVVVDDGSTDATRTVVSEVAGTAGSARVRLVSVPDGGSGSGKVAAIDRGIRASRGDVIVTLDADCVVKAGWLEALMSYMDEDVGFVAGPVAYEAHGSLLRRVEALEFLSLIGVGAGAIGRGRPMICNSANAAYRRLLYDQMTTAGGSSRVASADELLLNFVHESTPYRVVFCPRPEALVTTHGAETVRHFVRQRMRWVGIVPHLPRRHGVALILAYIFFLLLAGSLAAGLWVPTLGIAALGVLALKSLVDFRLLQAISRPFRMQHLLSVLPIAELLYLPYVLLTAPAGTLRETRWKGRVPQPSRKATALSVESQRP